MISTSATSLILGNAVLAGEARSVGSDSLAAGFQIVRAILYLFISLFTSLFISATICVGFFRPEWLRPRDLSLELTPK